MDEWQPISTAPKDGTEILVGQFGRKKYPCYNVVAWDEPSEGYSHPWIMVEGDRYARDWPTHWMPLPAPPEVREE